MRKNSEVRIPAYCLLDSVFLVFNDPKAYTKPWSVAAKVHLLPQDDLIEYVCEENNKAPGHMVGK